jgi:hypothetical protein
MMPKPFLSLFIIPVLYALVFEILPAVNAGGNTRIDLIVNAAVDRHPISPDIYGINNYDSDHAIFDDVSITVERWGGNATTNYNWLVDSSNSASDFFYIGGKDISESEVVPGKEVDDMVGFDKCHAVKMVLTIPLIGFVNKFSYINCSYPESVFPRQGLLWSQYDFCPWQKWTVNPPGGIDKYPKGERCGSGLDPDKWRDGVQLSDDNPLRNYIQVDASWMQDWIQHLVKTHSPAASGGVTVYEMDNEPESWSPVHHDVHPGNTGFDELLNLTFAYASMIKTVDPSAKVLGPSNWGVPAYYEMGKAGDNQDSHGMPWYQYYLTKMRDYEAQHGIRLLDYFDQHFYPSVDGTSIANDVVGDQSTQKGRLRSTRALWDPAYLQENWMGQWFPDTYGKAMVIPHLWEWVDQYYPGTKIAITEYNWGGLEDINGALAQADVLGIFGREGLDLATLWGPPRADQPGAFAFRMYRNYDGQGSQYGDIWVESSSAEQEQLAIYGSQRSKDGALTLMVINKTDNELTSNLTIRRFLPRNPSAQVYRYSSANLAAIVNLLAVPLTRVSEASDHPSFDYVMNCTFPANSITLFVLPGRLTPDWYEPRPSDERRVHVR